MKDKLEKVLIVDDDIHINELIDMYLKSGGYSTKKCFNGNDACNIVSTEDIGLVILDVMLPGKDGIEVLKQIRKNNDVPVIMLTAKGEIFDKVLALELGADDYIVKPFSLVELEARVQAHLRREERHQTNTKVKFSGELLIDYSERNVYIQNQPIGLVKKEFDIVELLSQNAGQVFDKERIYERVWGYDSEGDSSVVAEHIRRIRTKIAAYTNKSYIETVWGCGYKWIR